MTYLIRNSIDVEFTKASAIAIAGPSGSGKTESAMRLARGYCGAGEKFIIIDTEEKRALYKKERYQPWDWLDFQPPFSPEACKEVLDVCKGYRAVIWDSGSAEYCGDGGLQDIQGEALEKMAHGDPKRMEALVGPSWKDAKVRHKHVLMQYLIRYPTMLVVCLRSEPKVKFTKIDGRMTIVDAGYQPICEKLFMYEMLVACQMTAAKAGVPEHIKELEPDLKPVFREGEQINESTGERLAAWSNIRKLNGAKEDTGRTLNGGVNRGHRRMGDTTDAEAGAAASSSSPTITQEQISELENLCFDAGLTVSALLAAAKVESIGALTVDRLAGAKKWVATNAKATQ